MAQIMALDYGKTRIGLAVTDSLGIIAFGLETIQTHNIWFFLSQYFKENNIEDLVIGLPIDLKGNLNELEQDIQLFILKFQDLFPKIKIHRLDERFTSKIASYFISQSGMKKSKKQEKGLIDKVSATLLLQNFLEKK